MTARDPAAGDGHSDDDRRLSPERLAPLRAVFGPDLPALVHGFLEDLSLALATLERVATGGDEKAAWETAHKLGGSSGMFGALHLEMAFRRLEDALEARTPDIGPLVAEVKARAAAVRPALQALAAEDVLPHEGSTDRNPS